MSKEHLMGEESYSYEYRFTKQEIDEFAVTMAEKCKQIEKLEAEKKAQAAAMKEEIDAEMFTMRTAASKHRNKKEWRTDSCLKIADYERGEIIYRDKVTGQERGCRQMTGEERHIPLIPTLPPETSVSMQ